MIAPQPKWVALAVSLVLFVSLGCERKSGPLRPFPPNTDPVVFVDGFGEGVDYHAFLGSKLDAVSIDLDESFQGTASLRIEVEDTGFSGGAFVASRVRQLSGYDALTFWAKATTTASLNVAGLGNDNTGTSKFTAERSSLLLTTNWQKYVIPIPLPSRLANERGLFFFADDAGFGSGYTIWLDEVRFEKLGTLVATRASMTSRAVNAIVGTDVQVSGAQTVFDSIAVAHMPGYFDFTSSDDQVAVASGGEIRVVGAGMATVTAKLDTLTVSGQITVLSISPPAIAAPDPTVPQADVISLFSNVYANVQVDTWSADWDVADVTDIQIQGNDTKAYTNLLFAGIEFTSQPINGTDMTHLHLDVYLPTGTTFRVKLVDFGPNGVFGPQGAGNDDSEHELTFNAGTTPSVTPGTWSQLEIPLADFTNLTGRTHLAQLVISGSNTAYIDNLYLHK